MYFIQVIVFHCIETTEYYFQVEFMYTINITARLLVLVQTYTTTASVSSCSQLDDGTTQFHHTSVSCSKVCQLWVSFFMICALKYVLLFMKNSCVVNGQKHVLTMQYGHSLTISEKTAKKHILLILEQNCECKCLVVWGWASKVP